MFTRNPVCTRATSGLSQFPYMRGWNTLGDVSPARTPSPFRATTYKPDLFIIPLVLVSVLKQQFLEICYLDVSLAC